MGGWVTKKQNEGRACGKATKPACYRYFWVWSTFNLVAVFQVKISWLNSLHVDLESAHYVLHGLQAKKFREILKEFKRE